MQDSAVSLVGSWKIACPVAYLLVVVLLCLAIRAIMSVLAAFEHPDGVTIREQAGRNFLGFASRAAAAAGKTSDYWYNFILGLLEIASYPVIMWTGNWSFIGAWIGLKTVAQWSLWSQHRPTFNRFLIGNALALLASLALAHLFIGAAA